jgi:hypothetical protein
MDTLINEIIESELVDSTLYLSTTDQGNKSLRHLFDFIGIVCDEIDNILSRNVSSRASDLSPVGGSV